MMHIGVVGSGVVGLLASVLLQRQGHHVTVLSESSPDSDKSTAYCAAGMLTPVAELTISSADIYDMGISSIQFWRTFIPTLSRQVYFAEKGSLLLAHDLQEMHHFIGRAKSNYDAFKFEALNLEKLMDIEAELSCQHSYFLPDEAHLNPRQLLTSLRESMDGEFIWETFVTHVEPGLVQTTQQDYRFDYVFDCRGIGAADNQNELRAVRGELIYLSAPEVSLSRPVRLLHPRYPLYIVPQSQDVYVVGATEIEGDDRSTISVRSCLELLSAVYSVHSGFAEARILETVVGLRPAYPDNLPRVDHQPGLISINGLYRHGFLLAPALVMKGIDYLEHKV